MYDTRWPRPGPAMAAVAAVLGLVAGVVLGLSSPAPEPQAEASPPTEATVGPTTTTLPDDFHTVILGSYDERANADRRLRQVRDQGASDEALRRIVQCTHDLFAVDGASLMLIDPDQLLRSVADSDERVGHLEELQIRHGEGPCIDAFDDKELVHAADLAAERRWPSFSPAAVERGLRAVLASPIPYNQMAIGVVAVFSATVRPWTPEGELALIAFTMQSEERGELAAQLQRALDARVLIEQAKGALVARDGVTAGEAFEQMRRRARAERRRVVEIAQEIMSGTGRT